MDANIKRAVLYGLVISLIILALAISGCKTTTSPASPASTGSPTASPTTAAQQRPGFNGTPPARSATPTPTPSPSAVAATPSSAGSLSPSPSPSSAISTAIPILPQGGTSVIVGDTPIILITMPLNVSIVPAGDVTVSTVVSNFNLVKGTGQGNAVGEGHIIYYMDVTPPTMQGQTATTGAGTYAESTATSYTWHNVQPGFHYFSVQLVNNDSTPLLPAIKVTVYVTVQATSQSNSSPSPTMTPVSIS